jgi:hypothetical protein
VCPGLSSESTDKKPCAAPQPSGLWHTTVHRISTYLTALLVSRVAQHTKPKYAISDIEHDKFHYIPPVIRNPRFEMRVSDFLASTASGTIVRTRLADETAPESSSERFCSVKIYRRASPTHLEGSRGPCTNQNKEFVPPPAEGLLAYRCVS